MGGLLSYGREYMPGPDTRSGMDQLRGLLGAAQPYAEAVGGLLGYQPGMAEALAAEQEMKRQRLAANPGKRISEVLPIDEPWPANDAFGAGLMGAFGGSIKNVPKGLDMSQAARMARAREMGFDVDNPVYYGTNRNFKAFERRPVAFGNNWGSGHYFAKDQRMAETFAQGKGANMQKNIVALKSPFDPFNVDQVMSLIDGLPEYTKKTRAAGGQPEIPETMLKSFADKAKQRVADSQKKGGAVARMELIDFAERYQDLIRQKHDGITVGGETVVFDPANIRSIHAAFDPAKRNSADLLASVGGLGLLGYGGISGGTSE
jgi:hypothetical protein